jgi:hypothetical protein
LIVGTELRNWSTAKDAQQRTRASMDAFAGLWNRGPANCAFAAFATAMAGLQSRDAESVIARVRERFEDDSWVDDLIGSLAVALRHDPFFEPPFRHINSEVHKGIIVFEDDNVSVAVGVTSVAQLATKKSAKRERASIMFSGQVELFKFIKAGDARLSFWKAPRITERFSAASAGRYEFAGERRIRDGEILHLDGRCESFVIEHAAANLFVLQATAKPDRAPVSVEYDAASGGYAGCSAADDSASRIQMISTLLRKLDCTAAFPAIAAFLDHPSFFVRWHVMRELLGLDAAAALPHLKRMAARDPHPETRGVARTVLDRIEARPGKRREAA